MRHFIVWTVLFAFVLTSFAEPRPFLERLKDGRPFLIGHRGRAVLKYGGKFRENTRGSFDAAGRAGLQAIETDVRLTADGALVCAHDANLKRVFKVDLDVEKSALAEVRRHAVPTFDEYLDACARFDAVPFIETKGDVKVVAPVVDVLRRRGLLKVAVLSSCDFAHIRAARRLDRDLFVHHIFSKPELLDELASMGNAGLSWNYPDLSRLPAGLVERTHAKGVRCCLRACDSAEDYRAMRALKLDYYPTNRLTPDELADTEFRLQAHVHGLALKDGRYAAEFILGRSDALASAPVRFAWKGAPGATYAVAVNGHDLGPAAGAQCEVVAPKSCLARDPQRLEIRVTAGADAALSDPDRVAVFISVPAEKGPHLSLHGLLERLALPVDVRDEAAAARAFVKHVRETYRAEPEVLAQIRGEGDPAEWERALAHGRSALDYRFEEVGSWYTFPERRVAWQFNPTRNGYNEWCFHFACARWSRNLACYYAKTGDERAAATWRDLCLSLFTEEVVPESKNGYGTSTWRSLDTSERLSRLMGDLAVFLKSPALTDDFLLVFFRSMWEHAHRLRTSHAWGGNWFSNEMTCLYRFTYLMPYFKDNDEWRAYALAAVTRELKGQVYPDGQQNELAGGYHASVARQFLRVPAVCRFAGVEPPADLMSTVERMFNPYMVLMRPDGRIPGLNDSGDREVAPFLSLGARLFPDRADMRWFATAGKEGACPVWLSRDLPYMGAAAMRTSWKKDAVWAYMDCGPFGTGHQHEDKLNVLLWAYGRKLLSEGGFYDYDTSEMRKYVLSTRSHNTVRFDGGDQNRRAGYRWKPADIAKKADFEFATSPSVDVAAAAYDEAYARSPKAGLKHARRLMLFKQVPGVAPFLVVADRYSATDGRPHTYEQIWHLADGAFARLCDRGFLAEYPGGVGLAGAFSDAEAKLVDKRGQTEPELQGWNPGAWSRNNASPVATPVLCGAFTAPRRVVAVLQPLRKAGEPCVRAVRASADVADTAFTLVLSDGREIVLDETGRVASARGEDARTVVGVVNWDCSLPSDTWFGRYATTSLGPARFRHCTPFYADVKGPDRIDYHWRSVEEYEREMQYAIDAGIDYFAYCWYGEQKPGDGKDFTPVKVGRENVCDPHVWELATARQLHAKSSLRDKLKMCAILVTLHPLSDAEVESLARAMKEPWYQTARGRPLLYLFGGKGNGLLPRIRKACRAVGAGDPYAVVLSNARFETTGDDGVQAISAYVDGASGVDSFAEAAASRIDGNARRAATGMDVIPTFTLGWNPSPRLEHPVPWCGYGKTRYMRPATEAEWMQGAREMADWIRAHRASCPTGHILSFAWNEFEEGGWICPTWRPDGTPDTARVTAFRKVGELWRRTLDAR